MATPIEYRKVIYIQIDVSNEYGTSTDATKGIFEGKISLCTGPENLSVLSGTTFYSGFIVDFGDFETKIADIIKEGNYSSSGSGNVIIDNTSDWLMGLNVDLKGKTCQYWRSYAGYTDPVLRYTGVIKEAPKEASDTVQLTMVSNHYKDTQKIPSTVLDQDTVDNINPDIIGNVLPKIFGNVPYAQGVKLETDVVAGPRFLFIDTGFSNPDPYTIRVMYMENPDNPAPVDPAAYAATLSGQGVKIMSTHTFGEYAKSGFTHDIYPDAPNQEKLYIINLAIVDDEDRPVGIDSEVIYKFALDKPFLDVNLEENYQNIEDGDFDSFWQLQLIENVQNKLIVSEDTIKSLANGVDGELASYVYDSPTDTMIDVSGYVGSTNVTKTATEFPNVGLDTSTSNGDGEISAITPIIPKRVTIRSAVTPFGWSETTLLNDRDGTIAPGATDYDDGVWVEFDQSTLDQIPDDLSIMYDMAHDNFGVAQYFSMAMHIKTFSRANNLRKYFVAISPAAYGVPVSTINLNVGDTLKIVTRNRTRFSDYFIFEGSNAYLRDLGGSTFDTSANIDYWINGTLDANPTTQDSNGRSEILISALSNGVNVATLCNNAAHTANGGQYWLECYQLNRSGTDTVTDLLDDTYTTWTGLTTGIDSTPFGNYTGTSVSLGQTYLNNPIGGGDQQFKSIPDQYYANGGTEAVGIDFSEEDLYVSSASRWKQDVKKTYKVPTDIVTKIKNGTISGIVVSFTKESVVDNVTGITVLYDFNFYQLAFIGTAVKNLWTDKLLTSASGELVSAVESDNMQVSAQLASGANITPDVTGMGRDGWRSGRQLVEAVQQLTVLKSIAADSYTVAFWGSNGNLVFRNFIERYDNTPVANFTFSNIVKNSISPKGKTRATEIYTEFEFNYAYNPGSEKYDKTIFIKGVEDYAWFPAEGGSWKTVVGGIDDYDEAKALWDRCKFAYTSTGIVRQFKKNLRWYQDPTLMKSEESHTDVTDLSAFKYAQLATIWMTSQKEFVSFNIPTTSANLSLKLMDLITLQDEVATFDFVRKGFVMSILDNYKTDQLRVLMWITPFLDGQLLVTPDFHDFGIVADFEDLTVTLEAPSDKAVTINSITFGTGTKYSYIGTTPPFVMAASETKQFDIRYSPTTPGTDTEVVTISNNIGPNKVINCTGNAAVITVVPTSLDFGIVSGSSTLPVTVSSDAENGGAIEVSSITFDDGTEFSDSDISFPYDLYAGVPKPIDVTYTPLDTGSDIDTMYINNSTTIPKEVDLEGEAAASIVEQTARGTHTLTAGTLSDNIYVGNSVNWAGFQNELKISARTVASSITDSRHYAVSGYLYHTEGSYYIRVTRGVGAGAPALTVSWEVIAYTVASGAIVDSWTKIGLNAGNNLITVPDRSGAGKTYVRHYAHTPTNNTFAQHLTTAYMSTSTTVIVNCPYANSDIEIRGQNVYIPDQTVAFHELNATTSLDQDFTVATKDVDNTFAVVSQRAETAGQAMEAFNFGGVYLKNDTTINIFAKGVPDSWFVVQRVTRPGNTVTRDKRDTTSNPILFNFPAVDTTKSGYNYCLPYYYISAVTSSKEARYFASTLRFFNNTNLETEQGTNSNGIAACVELIEYKG